MKKTYIFIILLLLSGCNWIQEKRNEQVFNSEEYMQEEALVYSQLLEQMTNPARDFKDKNRRFLFFLQTDTLRELEIEDEDKGYLPGNLKPRKLNLDDINKFNNLKVLYIPKGLSREEKEKLDSVYWEYRKDYLTTKEVIELTRVAFNETYTKGFLSYTYDCGLMCGGGCGLYIKKVNGRWTIDKKGFYVPPE